MGRAFGSPELVGTWMVVGFALTLRRALANDTNDFVNSGDLIKRLGVEWSVGARF